MTKTYNAIYDPANHSIICIIFVYLIMNNVNLQLTLEQHRFELCWSA